MESLVRRSSKSSNLRRFVKKNRKQITQANIHVLPPMATDKMAIIIGADSNPAFAFSVKSVLTALGPDWSLRVYVPRESYRMTRLFVRNVENIQFHTLPHTFMGDKSYHELLSSPSFWGSIDAKQVAIFQPETILLGKGIDLSKYLDFDLVMSSCTSDTTATGRNISDISDTDFTANEVGAFSLRNVASMRRIVTSFKRREDSPEDVYFCDHAKRLGMKLPKSSEILNFSPDFSEVGISRIDGSVHARWHSLKEADATYLFNVSLNFFRRKAVSI